MVASPHAQLALVTLLFGVRFLLTAQVLSVIMPLLAFLFIHHVHTAVCCFCVPNGEQTSANLMCQDVLEFRVSPLRVC